MHTGIDHCKLLYEHRLKLGQLRKMGLYIWVKWRIFVFNIRWERTAINHLSPGRNLLLIVVVHEAKLKHVWLLI